MQCSYQAVSTRPGLQYCTSSDLLLQGQLSTAFRKKKIKNSISDFLANLLQKPCTNLMAGDFLQVTSLQKTAMSRGGSEAQAWKVSGLSPLHSHPQQEGERWLHLCARSLLALFLVADAKRDKLYVGAFWCEVPSAGIGVSAVNSFISRSPAGWEPRSKGHCFIHRNTQPTFNTSNHVRTSYSLRGTTCSPSSWKYHVRVTYIRTERTEMFLVK